MHNSAKLRCGKLGGKCGKAHGIVEKVKLFTRYRLYMERQYTLRIHFYDMLRAGTLANRDITRLRIIVSTFEKGFRQKLLSVSTFEKTTSAKIFLMSTFEKANQK